jgi:hypothetical protein
METKITKVNTPPPHGWVNELAKLARCTRTTVRTAIYDNRPGVKADRVRRLYKMKYENQII